MSRDIVIIGGGIIGCCSAYYLTRHPRYDPSVHRITLLEASTIAGGSSGKAGGLVAKWAFPQELAGKSFELHKELAEQHDGVKNYGYRPVTCGEVSCKARLPGSRVPGGPPTSTPANKSSESRRNGLPHDLDWLETECVQDYDIIGGEDVTAQVHPARFTAYIANLARDAGVTIKLDAQVQSIDRTNGVVHGVTYTDTTDSSSKNGRTTTIPATDVVLAAGPWTARLVPGLPIESYRVHSITIEPSRPLSAHVVFTSISLPSGFHRSISASSPSASETRDAVSGGGGSSTHKPHLTTRSRSTRPSIVSPEIYARPDHEAYISGESDHHDAELPSTTAHVLVDTARCDEIRDHVAGISESLRDGTVTARQACYLPAVVVKHGSGHGQHGQSQGPLLGRLVEEVPPENGSAGDGYEGLVIAAGHSCWGISNGPVTGKIVAEFVLDGDVSCACIDGFRPWRIG